jgi:ABC-type Na+ transport system ATPase subunit NatA
MLSLVNGVKNDPTYDNEGNYVKNRKTPQTDLWNKLTSQKGLMYFNQLVDLEDYENQNILNEFLEIIPGLKERVSNLKTVKKEADTVLDD